MPTQRGEAADDWTAGPRAQGPPAPANMTGAGFDTRRRTDHGAGPLAAA
ncbi:MAG: hypothetical protein AVDCRST_MAG29-2133 [uncultured Nocardioidaceae bacterium]|uniref:Uncharacterized protein n=1 Tax=uncultured Nocardioidaceae bacterium TaxID=253824 RepID=A0A6J4M439_9ACTN|nr:MAG: hypothetical protein AVDCRST_MAG29-2133 [uncultured Nocardioidaceae bacterium]